jgi:hypothetical protein
MFLIAIVLLVVLMIPVAAVVLDSPVGRALASDRTQGRLGAGRGSRMAALETEVERLGKEVNRLEEEATFLRQLLTEKPKPPELPPGGAS